MKQLAVLVSLLLLMPTSTLALAAVQPSHHRHHHHHRSHRRPRRHTPRAAREANPQTIWAPIGAPPLADGVAAARVTPEPENRPGNAAANDYVPSDSELQSFYSARNSHGVPAIRANHWLRYVTGRPGLSHPSTDDLIQWVAHKWGIPEDWLRAQMVLESQWHQDMLSDLTTVSASWYSLYPPQARSENSQVNESMGISQVKWRPDGSVGAGTEPLRWRSTAFALDYLGATLRWYYDGDCRWCGNGYSSGQQWMSVGAWYEPYPWSNAGQHTYIHKVQAVLVNRLWARPGF